MTGSMDNPILNSPYDQLDRYYEIGPLGPTGEIKGGRRPSESFIPITGPNKRGKSYIVTHCDERGQHDRPCRDVVGSYREDLRIEGSRSPGGR
jgi:type III restriction enzyme